MAVVGLPGFDMCEVDEGKVLPSEHILDTVFLHASSVTWQGITHGLELLKKVIIWRVCDGSSINIWRDN